MKKTEPEDLPDEMRLDLRKPIKLGDDTIDHLDLREPTADEIDRFMRENEKNGAMAAMILFVSLVSGVEKPLIGRLGARDFKKAGDYLTNFISSGPKTGEN